MPVSATRMNTSASTRSTVTVIRPPGSEYLAELLSRLDTICTRRVWSPVTTSGSCGTSTTKTCPCASTRGVHASTAASTTSSSSTRSTRNTILPLRIRETSSRSSTRCTSCPSCRSIMLCVASACSGSRVVRSTAAPFTIEASGLRNSCERVARNSSFRTSWSANACSTSLSPVMSIAAHVTPEIIPPASHSGSTHR